MTVSWTGTSPGQSVMNRSTPVHAAELYRTGTAEEGRSSGSILENLNRNMLALTSHYTRKMVPITRRASSLQGERSSFLENVLYVRTLGFKNKIERRKRRRRQNNNRPINLPQGNNILHILHVHHLTLNFIIHNKYICDRLCENRTCRGINKNAVYPKIGGKRKFMDLLIMNSPVSLGIVLSIR